MATMLDSPELEGQLAHREGNREGKNKGGALGSLREPGARRKWLGTGRGVGKQEGIETEYAL